MEYYRKKILNYLKKIKYSCIQGILFVFLAFIFFSCNSLKIIGIQVALLPEYPIAGDIQSFALLNRSMTKKFTNIESDTLEKELVNRNMLMDSVFQDSIAADTVIDVASRALFESGRFDVVVPKELNIWRNDSDEIAKPLNSSFINDICNDYKVDAVLVLENFAEHLTTAYHTNGTLYGGKEYDAATDITYFSQWRLYRPNDLKPVIRFQVSDSIFWSEIGYSLQNLYSLMPRTKKALIGGGIATGLKMAEYISPKWTNQDRYYYLTGKSEIDSAIPLIINNKWENAAEIWTKYASVNSKTIRSKVEFNLALAAEMNGDLDLAIEWGLKSFKTRYTKVAEDYLTILDINRKAQQRGTKNNY